MRENAANCVESKDVLSATVLDSGFTFTVFLRRRLKLRSGGVSDACSEVKFVWKEQETRERDWKCVPMSATVLDSRFTFAVFLFAEKVKPVLRRCW